MTTYVLDTTILMANPEIISSLKGSNKKVIIPLSVIKQLDGLKNSSDEEKASKARRASRAVEDATVKGNGNVTVYTKYDPIDGLDSPADNRIVGTAVRLKKEEDSNVVLLTTDVNMRNVARGYGVEVSGGEVKKKPLTNNVIFIFVFIAFIGIVIALDFLVEFFAGVVRMMDNWVLIVGGIMIGLGLLLRFISEKTGYDFNDRRFFGAPKSTSDAVLDYGEYIGYDI